MKARERLLLILLAVIVGAVAVVTGGAALRWIPLSVLRTSVEAVSGSVEYAILSILLLAFAVFFLLSSIRTGGENVQTIVQMGPLGEVRVSFKAVENLVLKAARGSKGVQEVKTRIQNTERGLVIYLRAVSAPDQNIPQVTAELQQLVKNYVEESTGVTVAEIKVLIENVAGDMIKAAR
ncbi:MAG TPA: alkaline shock response membrane anchor protein AmaP [Firmicutes bacterium]|nr:alkaline shock response membrane anchor protein AmaP [Bacillota bacterium]